MADSTRDMAVAGRGIGIDAGACSVKVAVVRRGLGGLVLEHVAEQPVPRDAAGRPPAERVSEAVAAAMAGIKIGRAVVVAGAPTQLSTVRNLDVPFTKAARIRRVVKTEVEPHLPFAAEDIVVDYCPTGLERAPAGAETAPPGEKETAEAGGARPAAQTNLLITAIQKRVVGDLLGTISAEDLDPEVVDVEFMGAFSAVRALAPQTSEGGELVIDIGAVKTSVIYARKGRPLAVRAFNFGGDALTQAVAAATGASFAEAEQQKHASAGLADAGLAHAGLPDAGPQPDPAARAVTEALVALRRGLDQTLRFFASQVGDVQYDRVVVTGGSAALAGLKQWLAETLATDVVVLDSLGHLKNAAGAQPPVARCATAIGLALRGLGESAALYNFRQEELAYPNPLKRLAKYLAPAAALLVGIVVAALVGYQISYRSTLAKKRNYAAMTQAEIRKVVGESHLYPTLETLEDKVNERTAELESLSGKNPQSVLDVLLELSKICYRGPRRPGDARPPDNGEADPGPPDDGDDGVKALIKRSEPWKIQIWRFQMERGRVEIEGSAVNYTAVNQFKQAIEDSPLFASVRRRPSTTREGRETFNMLIYLQEP